MLGFGPVASYPICGPDALATPVPVVIPPTGGAGVRTRVVRRPRVHAVAGRLEVVAAPAEFVASGTSQDQIRGWLDAQAAAATIALRGRSEDEEGWLLGEEADRVLDSDEAEALWLLGFDE